MLADLLGDEWRAVSVRPPESPVLLQTAIAPFRDQFVHELMGRCPGCRIISGEIHFEPTVTLSPSVRPRTTIARNRFLLRRRLLWQSGVVGRVVRAKDPVVVELNPRILSTWLVLLLRRALGRRSVGWGHVWPRSGESSKTVALRRLMWRLPNRALLYTDDEVEQFRRLGLDTPAYVAANAVDRRSEVSPAEGPRLHLLQIGRLVPAKRPELLLRAFAELASDLPHNVELWYVGDGPLRREIDDLAVDLGLSTRVRFWGAVSNQVDLAEIFNSCLVSCIPGYAGLSLTQSLAHGLPCIIADDEPHAPEVTLASELNSRSFAAGSAASLANAIAEVVSNRTTWVGAARRISDDCLRVYSVESMVEGFLSAISSATP